MKNNSLTRINRKNVLRNHIKNKKLSVNNNVKFDLFSKITDYNKTKRYT